MIRTSSRAMRTIGIAATIATVVIGAAAPAAAGPSAPTGPQLPRIINGSDAAPGAWPAMVAIGYRGENARSGTFCGGTLVASRWVLTAAHCITGTRPYEIVARVGITSLWDAVGTGIPVTSYVRYRYRPSVDRNDIALLKLAVPSAAPPMDLASGDQYGPGSSATILGWGATRPSGRGMPSRLKQGTVQLTPDWRCERMWPDVRAAQQVCAGSWGLRPVDACSGDSGGPLIVAGPTGLPVVAGVVSYGPPRCAHHRLLTVFTKVAHYAPWIRAVVAG